MSIQNKQIHIQIARAKRSGRIQATFPIEKSTKNILHPKLQGASPAINASSTPPPRDFLIIFSWFTLVLSARIDCIKRYILKKKSMAMLTL